jgi:periplasmic protein TonB
MMSVSTIAGKLAVSLLLSVGVSTPLWAEEFTLRVSEEQATKAIKSKVNPEYPAMARQMKLGGKVQVDAYIDADGKVEKVQVVNGNALLTSAAVTAVKRWKFSPFTAEGKAVRAVAAFTFSFAP